MVGISRALEVALTGEAICEEEAKKFGIVSKFFPKETFHENTQALAEKVAAVPPAAAAAIKRMMYSSPTADLLMHLATEKAALTEMAGTPAFRELIRRFQEETLLDLEKGTVLAFLPYRGRSCKNPGTPLKWNILIFLKA